MSQLRTAVTALWQASLFALDRVRMGFLTIAAILLVKIMGAYWLPQAPAGTAPPSAGASVTVALP